MKPESNVISFAPTEEQILIRDMAEALARDVLRPAARDLDRAGTIAPPLLDQLAASGMIDLALSPDPDMPRLRTSTAIMLEAIGFADASLAVALAAPVAVVQAIMDQGSASQRETLRERWSNGGYHAAAFAVQEPGFGFDVAAPATIVVDDGNGLRLDGVKSCVALARECEFFLVVAADGDRQSAFIVPAGLAGIEIAPPSGCLGLRSLDLTEVRFTAVRLPASARLGEDAGADVQALIDSARGATAAIMTGVASAVLDHLQPYLKQRIAHGSALAQKQSVAFRLADMKIDIASMRWMAWNAAAAIDNGRAATREARLAQVHCAEKALWISDEGIQLMGGHGYLRDNPVERWYRDIRTLAALEGVAGL